MTDTAFYNDMAALATELMNDFGTPATLRQVTKPKPDADGKAEPVTADFPGLAVRINDLELLRAMELQGDFGYAMKFPAEVGVGDLLIHAGDTYDIQEAKPVNPEGSRILLAFGTVKRS